MQEPPPINGLRHLGLAATEVRVIGIGTDRRVVLQTLLIERSQPDPDLPGDLEI